MKVIAINGSARKNGNTAILINYTLEEINQKGIETDFIQLAGKQIHGCIACRKCFANKDQRCAVQDDILNGCLEKMLEADGIVLGSPTYFSDITTEMKALIDRSGYVAKANNDMFKRKVGAGIVVARRAGSIHAFDTLNHFFLISQMIIPGSRYWNLGFGKEIGEVEKDEEAILVMKTLGKNIAWLLKNINKQHL